MCLMVSYHLIWNFRFLTNRWKYFIKSLIKKILKSTFWCQKIIILKFCSLKTLGRKTHKITVEKETISTKKLSFVIALTEINDLLNEQENWRWQRAKSASASHAISHNSGEHNRKAIYWHKERTIWTIWYYGK